MTQELEITLHKEESKPTKVLIINLLRREGAHPYNVLAYELGLSLRTVKENCYKLCIEKKIELRQVPGHETIVTLPVRGLA